LYVLGRLLLLRRRRQAYGLVLAVGDVLAVLGGWLSGLPTAVYLVAYSSHYEGRLRLPWPCSWLLGRPAIRAIWSRDALTASDLSQQLARPVTFLGNPFLDVVSAQPSPPPASAVQEPQLLLVPGSRLPEAARNLQRMLQLLALLPGDWVQAQNLRLRAALVPDLTLERLTQLGRPLGWQLEGQEHLSCGPLRLELAWGQFAAMLPQASLALCMAGTAAEQAVGLGKPVLQLPGRGPQFTADFAEAQRRLLGPGVHWAGGARGQTPTLEASAALARTLLDEQADPARGPARRQQLAAIGLERIGRPGGSQTMAAAIMTLLAAPTP
ncbi:lipid-A-disaccharide synthase-related protein, partial [Cyanobium sp. T1B-Tous]|uniref:lipid-A-disaccharide synthase-related protein n=1 Tax=Cyanobium sp. T1B-Tous TaxID=2823721 RepID=UPI0020CDB3AD